MAAGTMSLAQFCLLATALSALVYYLTTDNICGTAGSLQGTTILGTRLNPSNGKQHVLVTGGAGYIGSHAALRLLRDGHAVTVLDNLSRGNLGAVNVLKQQASPGQFQFIEADLGHGDVVKQIFQTCKFDTVMHFAAVAYVGESMAEPLRYYHNITANVVNVMEAVKASTTRQLVFSSTCATYGNPAKLPVTEETPTLPINPYGRAKLMAEQVIRDYLVAEPSLNAIIFRYFNVYGSDPHALLGEWPRPELRQHARISGACLDAATHDVDHLTITGTSHPTRDGTCIRDFIHVADLIDAHVLGMRHLANPAEVFNIGTGKGISVREFVEACKSVTGESIKVVEQRDSRPGDYAEIWADPAKIERVMGWHAQYTDVEESLAHAWAWRKKHPHGYAT